MFGSKFEPAANDTNQPQVLHTSTGKCTDKTCLMPGRPRLAPCLRTLLSRSPTRSTRTPRIPRWRDSRAVKRRRRGGGEAEGRRRRTEEDGGEAEERRRKRGEKMGRRGWFGVPGGARRVGLGGALLGPGGSTALLLLSVPLRAPRTQSQLLHQLVHNSQAGMLIDDARRHDRRGGQGRRGGGEAETRMGWGPGGAPAQRTSGRDQKR